MLILMPEFWDDADVLAIQGTSSGSSGDDCVTSSKSCSNYRGDTWSCKFGQFCGTAQFTCFGVATGCLGGIGSGSGSSEPAAVSSYSSSITAVPSASSTLGTFTRSSSGSSTSATGSSSSAGSSEPTVSNTAARESIVHRHIGSLGFLIIVIMLYREVT